MEALLQTGLSNGLMATALAVIAACIGRFCRRPALVHCLWLLVLLKFITPSFVACPIPWPDGSTPALHALSTPPHAEAAPDSDTRLGSDQKTAIEQTKDTMTDFSLAGLIAASLWAESTETLTNGEQPGGSTAATVERSNRAPTPSSPLSWLWMVGAVWLAGSISWFTLVAYRIYRFQRFLRCAHPASPKLCEQVQRLAGRLGLAACPSMSFLPGRLSPMVWALGGRPRLLVPSALWERLSAEQQTTLLVHELAHLRRRDFLVRGLELLVTGLYWWHPVVWWACREIREAEEQCCDAWVVWTLPRAARAYATALLATIDFLSETQNALPVVASGIGHVHDLKRRLTMIMHGKTRRALSGAGLLLVLGLGAFLLPLRPTWAQVEDPRARRAAQEADEQRRAAEEEQAQADEAQQEAAREQTRRRFETERDRFRAERQKLMEEVGRMKSQLDRAMSELKRAEERLSLLQNQERTAAREAVRQQTEQTRQQTPRGPAARRAAGREQVPDSERRLAELEKKLEDLLAEVQNLRREMRRPGPAMRGAPGTTPAPRPPRGPSTPPPPGAPPDLVVPSPRDGDAVAPRPPSRARGRGVAPPALPTAPAPPAAPAPRARPAPEPSPNGNPEPSSPEIPSSIPL